VAWLAAGFQALEWCDANAAAVDDIEQIIDVPAVNRHDEHRAHVSDYFGDALRDEVVAERGMDVVAEAGVKVTEFDAIEHAAKRSHHSDAHTQSIWNRAPSVNLDRARDDRRRIDRRRVRSLVRQLVDETLPRQ
jgi:hypothetical protein